LPVGDGDGADGDTEGEADGECDGDADAVGDTEAEGDTDADAVGDTDGDGELGPGLGDAHGRTQNTFPRGIEACRRGRRLKSSTNEMPGGRGVPPARPGRPARRSGVFAGGNKSLRSWRYSLLPVGLVVGGPPGRSVGSVAGGPPGRSVGLPVGFGGRSLGRPGWSPVAGGVLAAAVASSAWQ